MELARLVVEGEEGDVDLAGAQQLDGHRPQDAAVVADEDVDAVHEAGGGIVRTVDGDTTSTEQLQEMQLREQ